MRSSKVGSFVLFLGMVLVPVSVLGQTSLEPETDRITEATVYVDQAVITREVQVRSSNTQDVPVEIRVRVPSDLESGELRARVPIGGKVSSVRLETEHFSTVTDTQLRQVEQSLTELQHEKKKHQARIEGEEERLNFLRNTRTTYNEKLASEILAQPESASTAASVGATVADGITEARQTILDTRQSIEEIERKIDALERRQEELEDRRDRTRQYARVSVTEPTDEITLELSYPIGNARWRPKYNLRTTDEADRVRLEMVALVRQNTGEDWSDVNLTVSTGEPGSRTEPPEREPVELEPPRERPSAASSATSADAMRSVVPSSPIRNENREATKIKSGPATSFTLPSGVTVRGDGEWEERAIRSFRLPSDQTYLAVPAESEDVFFRTAFHNNQDVPIPPGEADIFVGETYQGTVERLEALPGDTATVSLGVDQRLNNNRRILAETSGSSFFGGQAHRTIGLEYEITNSLDRSVTVETRDRVPVSRHEDIEVEILQASQPYDQDENGIVSWERTVPANGSVELELRYRVSVPSKWESVLEDVTP